MQGKTAAGERRWQHESNMRENCSNAQKCLRKIHVKKHIPVLVSGVAWWFQNVCNFTLLQLQWVCHTCNTSISHFLHNPEFNSDHWLDQLFFLPEQIGTNTGKKFFQKEFQPHIHNQNWWELCLDSTSTFVTYVPWRSASVHQNSDAGEREWLPKTISPLPHHPNPDWFPTPLSTCPLLCTPASLLPALTKNKRHGKPNPYLHSEVHSKLNQVCLPSHTCVQNLRMWWSNSTAVQTLDW